MLAIISSLGSPLPLDDLEDLFLFEDLRIYSAEIFRNLENLLMHDLGRLHCEGALEAMHADC